MKIRCVLGVAAALCTSAVALAQPAANDTCGANQASFTIPGTGGSATQAINTTTSTWSRDGAACAGSTGADVYYYFTPATAGPWRFSTCSSSPVFDSVLSIHTACPTSTANYATGSASTSCNDTGSGCSGDTSTFDAPALTVGTTYVIRVARFSGAAAATPTLTVTNLNVSGACCTAGSCNVQNQPTCVSPSTFLGAGTTCTPNNCPQPPANDTCANAAPITPGTAVTANNATATSTGDGPAATCQSSSGKGIFYKFSPASTGAFMISACGSPQDTVLQVFTTPDCTTFTAVACDDDTCAGGETGLCGAGTGNGLASVINSVTLTGGTTYYIRLSSFGSAPVGGCLTLLMTTLSTPGACCNLTTGACTVVQSSACLSPNTYQGDGSACPNVNCPASGSCCVGQCCTVLTSASCTTLGGAFTAAGTCAAGSCTAAVANDLCGNAIALTLGTPVVGCNVGATVTAGSDPTPTCQSSFGATVWYKFTPASTGFYDLSMCGSSFDSILDVFTTPDCLTFSSVACDDDACVGGEPGVVPGTTGNGLASVITAAQLTGGQLYYVRVSGFGTATGTFRVLVTGNATAGACCNSTTGACTISTTGSTGCAAGTTFLGGVCTPTNPCPQPNGACCNPNGTCTVGSGSSCTTGGGLFQGPASVCGAGGTCPITAGSCCSSTGVCTYIATTSTCTGVFTSGGLCSPNTCPQPATCCVAGCCTVTLPAGCTGTVGAPGSTCVAGACGVVANDECAGATTAIVGANPGSNCGATTSFVVTPATQCGTFTGSGGAKDVWQKFTPTQSANYTFDTCATPGFDTTLALYNSCPANGTVAPVACNDDTAGTCAISTLRSEIANQLLVAGNTYFIRVAAYDNGAAAEGAYVLNITQGAAAGACCTGTTCTVVLAINCASGYQGNFTACTPTNPCLPTTGACCCGATCSVTTLAGCSGTNRAFSGPGTLCNAAGVNTTPCCLADYNKSGAIGVQDIFDFLAAYFAMDTCADINASGGVPTVQDIFDYLGAYFAGGC